jgi:hypothetical protein
MPILSDWQRGIKYFGRNKFDIFSKVVRLQRKASFDLLFFSPTSIINNNKVGTDWPAFIHCGKKNSNFERRVLQ